jgi:hypothetical protein
MSAGRPSQQISNENGRSLAGMNPGAMRPRDANATSIMLAMSACLFRLPRLKRISVGVVLGPKILPAKLTGNTGMRLETRKADNSVESAIEMKWVGACPAGMKLGDVAGPDGKVMMNAMAP